MTITKSKSNKGSFINNQNLNMANTFHQRPTSGMSKYLTSTPKTDHKKVRLYHNFFLEQSHHS
jgi:hypothetical protein